MVACHGGWCKRLEQSVTPQFSCPRSSQKQGSHVPYTFVGLLINNAASQSATARLALATEVAVLYRSLEAAVQRRPRKNIGGWIWRLGAWPRGCTKTPLEYLLPASSRTSHWHARQTAIKTSFMNPSRADSQTPDSCLQLFIPSSKQTSPVLRITLHQTHWTCLTSCNFVLSWARRNEDLYPHLACDVIFPQTYSSKIRLRSPRIPSAALHMSQTNIDGRVMRGVFEKMCLFAFVALCTACHTGSTSTDAKTSPWVFVKRVMRATRLCHPWDTSPPTCSSARASHVACGSVTLRNRNLWHNEHGLQLPSHRKLFSRQRAFHPDVYESAYLCDCLLMSYLMTTCTSTTPSMCSCSARINNVWSLSMCQLHQRTHQRRTQLPDQLWTSGRLRNPLRCPEVLFLDRSAPERSLSSRGHQTKYEEKTRTETKKCDSNCNCQCKCKSNSGEESAFPINSSSSSASHKFDGSVSYQRIHPGSRCRSLWVVEAVELVVELVGLITCERVVYRHKAMLLILRMHIGFSARRSRPQGSWSSRQRTERESRGTRDRGRKQNKETTNAQTCDDMCTNIFLCRHVVRHLEPMWCVHKDESVEKKSRVRCICPQCSRLCANMLRLANILSVLGQSGENRGKEDSSAPRRLTRVYCFKSDIRTCSLRAWSLSVFTPLFPQRHHGEDAHSATWRWVRATSCGVRVTSPSAIATRIFCVNSLRLAVRARVRDGERHGHKAGNRKKEAMVKLRFTLCCEWAHLSCTPGNVPEPTARSPWSSFVPHVAVSAPVWDWKGECLSR